MGSAPVRIDRGTPGTPRNFDPAGTTRIVPAGGGHTFKMTSFEHNLSFSGECFLAGASSHLLPPTIHPYPASTVCQDKHGMEPAKSKGAHRMHVADKMGV